MSREVYNIQQTNKAACNTGNKNVKVSPISAIIMPGYSLPIPQTAPIREDAFLRNLLKSLKTKDIQELLKELEE